MEGSPGADGSTNNAKNLVCLLQSSNAYPILERLEITISECVPLEMGAANATNAIFFLALQTLALNRVHSMVLRRGVMPSLLDLKLDGLGHNLYFSQLLSLLSGTPALPVIMLQHTLRTLDPHRVVNVGRSPPRWLPTGPLNASGTIGVKLHNLVSLSLNPAPTSGLWMLLLSSSRSPSSKPSTSTSTPTRTARTSGGSRPTAANSFSGPSPSENPTPHAWTVRLSALRTLLITYCISPSPSRAPASTPNIGHIASPQAQPPLPQLRRIVFPALASLEITHALAWDPRVPDTPWPPLPPLPTFDAFFHIPDFTRLALLSLVGCALPCGALCDALRMRMLALEVLTLGPTCQGAGALVCALASGECDEVHDIERVHAEAEVGAGMWIGARVRKVVLRRCADVRAGCLRRVIEARLRASVSAPDARSETENMNMNESGEGEPFGGSKLAMRVGMPARITEMQVLECAGVTKDDMAALDAISGAPELSWSPQ